MLPELLNLHAILQGLLPQGRDLQKKFVPLNPGGRAPLLRKHQKDNSHVDKPGAGGNGMQHVLLCERQWRGPRRWIDEEAQSHDHPGLLRRLH